MPPRSEDRPAINRCPDCNAVMVCGGECADEARDIAATRSASATEEKDAAAETVGDERRRNELRAIAGVTPDEPLPTEWAEHVLRPSDAMPAAVGPNANSVAACEPRFFIDHGMIHDRQTGRHVTTTGEPPYEDGVNGCCALLNALVEEARTAVERERERIMRVDMAMHERELRRKNATQVVEGASVVHCGYVHTVIATDGDWTTVRTADGETHRIRTDSLVVVRRERALSEREVQRIMHKARDVAEHGTPAQKRDCLRSIADLLSARSSGRERDPACCPTEELSHFESCKLLSELRALRKVAEAARVARYRIAKLDVRVVNLFGAYSLLCDALEEFEACLSSKEGT